MGGLCLQAVSALKSFMYLYHTTRSPGLEKIILYLNPIVLLIFMAFSMSVSSYLLIYLSPL